MCLTQAAIDSDGEAGGFKEAVLQVHFPVQPLCRLAESMPSVLTNV